MDDARDGTLRRLTAGLAGIACLQFAIWLPTYLTRPWYADHDVFATMARGWDAGVLPYRDLLSNNFPGTIYLFWCLGKVFGWGGVRSFYAFDAALLVALAATTLWWSRARFGRALPAVVGLLAVGSYYFNLDYSLTAQRDWHAPLFVVLGLLAAQARPDRAGRCLAALGFSAGMLIRPQVVLLLPAALLAVTEGPRLDGPTRSRAIRVAAAWSALVALLIALGLLPLVRDRLVGDFLEGLRLVAYGGNYNQKKLGMVAKMFVEELATNRVSAAIAGLALSASLVAGRPTRALAVTWLVALAGALLYAPLSPNATPYLYHPLWLVWSIGVAALVGLILGLEAPPKMRLLGVLLALGLGTSAWPTYARPWHIGETLIALGRGREVRLKPSGYSHLYSKSLVLPPWADYQGVLDYLRDQTTPETRVANLLMGVAICGPAARLSALPAESATWIYVVNRSDEARFARALEGSPDSVVAWAPGEAIGQGPDSPDARELIRFPMLDEVTRRLYRPAARFGTLEVWRRAPEE